MSDKVVLEEEQYVEALERIIERDFFPDLSALRKQNERLRGDPTASVLRSGLASSVLRADADGTDRPARDVGSRRRAPASVARSEGSSWDHPTPTRAVVGGQGEEETDHDNRRHSSDPTAAVGGKTTAEMTLNRFVATHTSEDNAAFVELQEKAIEDHKRRYHWAYDVDQARGDPKLHLLSNGKWISKEQRQLVDRVLAPEGAAKDDRPSAPETWPFRARNALLFIPELETSRQICEVNTQDAVPLLENGDPAAPSSSAITKYENGSGRSGRPPRAKRETVYSNSRFRHDSRNESTPESGTHNPPNKRELSLVQMTPVIAPGVDASPLMTWGDIETTPMILDPRATPDRILSGPSFVVKENSAREQIANRLESQARVRKSQSQQRTPTPLISRGKRPAESATPSRSESIRSRLSSVRSLQRTPLFGANSELRASYATPQLPPRHAKSSSRKK